MTTPTAAYSVGQNRASGVDLPIPFSTSRGNNPVMNGIEIQFFRLAAKNIRHTLWISTDGIQLHYQIRD